MAELTLQGVYVEGVKGPVEMLTPAQYAAKYADHISVQAVAYAMDNDLIDFGKLGDSRNRYVLMTKKTEEYAPNSHPERGNSGKKKDAAKAAGKETATPTTEPFKGGKASMAT